MVYIQAAMSGIVRAAIDTSSTISLAILEILVHLQDGRILSAFEVIPFHFDSRTMKTLDIKEIPGDGAPLPPSFLQRPPGMSGFNPAHP